MKILEKELKDSVRAIHAGLKSVFCHIDLEVHQQEFKEILKLQFGSSARLERLERWVDAVITSNAPLHPMVFAAVLMGFPMVPGVDEVGLDAEAAAFLDMYSTDPDLDDLREEFRPRLKERLDGWYRLSASFKGPINNAMLTRVYSIAVELMPFLGAQDAVDQLLNKLSSQISLPFHFFLNWLYISLGRLGERPSKSHIFGALESLYFFCNTQRKKIFKAEKAARRTNGKAAAGGSMNQPQGAAPPPPVSSPPTPQSQPSQPPPTATVNTPTFTFHLGPGSLSSSSLWGSPSSMAPPFGGMDDVD